MTWNLEVTLLPCSPPVAWIATAATPPRTEAQQHQLGHLSRSCEGGWGAGERRRDQPSRERVCSAPPRGGRLRADQQGLGTGPEQFERVAKADLREPLNGMTE